LKATLKVGFYDRRTLKAVDSSLAPDNVDFPRGMRFSQRQKANELKISIRINDSDVKKIETLISTLDEVLVHADSAIRTIERAEETS
jgi:hypothetical protein